MLLSIICVTKDDYQGLYRTLSSLHLLNLHFREEAEVIVVDGSDGPRWSELQNVTGSLKIPCRYFQQKDRSLYHAMNIGVSHARGTLLWMLNGGDAVTGEIASDGFFNHVSEIAEKNGVGVFQSVDGRGIVTIPDWKRTFFIHQAVIYSRKSHEKLGGYIEWRAFTASDYLYMYQLMRDDAFPKLAFDMCIASCAMPGLSAALRHFINRDIVVSLEKKESLPAMICRFLRTAALLSAKRTLRATVPLERLNRAKRWLAR